MRTAIKAHISGFYFCSLHKGFVSKADLSWRNTAFSALVFFPFSVYHCALGAAESRCHEFVWEVPTSTQTLKCAQSIMRVHACVFTCHCLYVRIRVYLTDVPYPNLSLQMLARSLPRIAEYRFPASLLEGEW